MLLSSIICAEIFLRDLETVILNLSTLTFLSLDLFRLSLLSFEFFEFHNYFFFPSFLITYWFFSLIPFALYGSTGLIALISEALDTTLYLYQYIFILVCFSILITIPFGTLYLTS